MEWWEKEGKWFDCFKELGIKESASEQEIKRAYRNLVKIYHPEGKNANREKFECITIAYNTLIDPKKRAKYAEYSKRFKQEQKNKSKEKDKAEEQAKNKEETMSFEDIVNEYKRRERQIKLYINGLILEIEKKEEKFNSIYVNLCKALKNKDMNAHDFEIRRQKLRSLELSNLTSIKEIEEMIKNDLKSINLEQEQQRLKVLKNKFKATEDILTSRYTIAILKLKKPKLLKKLKLSNMKKVEYNFGDFVIYGTFAFLISLTMFLMWDPLSIFKEEEAIVSEYDEENEEDLVSEQEKEITSEEIEDKDNQELVKKEEDSKINSEDIIDFDYKPDCILFQDIPDESEFVEFSNVYEECGMDVVRADDQYGVSYLLDANNHNNLLFGNYISHGGPYREDGKYYFVILTADGYHYKLDANDFRTVIDVESAYSYESEPFYLEGYGYVIEAVSCGEKYLIDAETRYAFIRNFDSYDPMYYDEEFGCNVYCFNLYDGDVKYYLAADDLRKVLKKESVWDDQAKVLHKQK